ncbi:V-type sodium ATPase, B subunit [Acetomicrobium hydrogeniformans ATCC BAA-1850]|jgi:V/A-type H+-transporting ATPase subunit B|uniref:V-type ATP synthase beta chain n=2 Tax=Acetomicrobium TaxID=49894 RepID=A0A0T5XCX5_9BACT|nr:V-type sodium ATPase, B subunit [Acetomicrobium hydrogeniformans ATCC BAA-1850]
MKGVVTMKLLKEGYKTIEKIAGPLLFVSKVARGGIGEIVKIESNFGEDYGQILQIVDDLCVIQVFGETMGLAPNNTVVWLERDVVKIPLGIALQGRMLNGRAMPIDGEGPISCIEKWAPIQGNAINPWRRKSPHEFIETGISTIDLMNTLVKGQKLPIFTGSGLPADKLAAQIVKYARTPATSADSSPFMVVFAALGITQREASYFREAFRESGSIYRGVFFFNLAGDPSIERILTPRMALTVAEYFAFEKGYDVLVVLTDMLHYCEALREISSAREEIPGRRGFPSYMYSDLASIYERAGCISGIKGSITQIPIVTMPDDDLTHPVPDLTGYITEGQIVMDRELHGKGIYPPIDVLSSLSRLMNKGIGEGSTVPEHRALSDQLYAAYGHFKDLVRLKTIIGEEGLTPTEMSYLSFGEKFESEFVNQGERRRSLDETLEHAWNCLLTLPKDELHRLPVNLIDEVMLKRGTKA